MSESDNRVLYLRLLAAAGIVLLAVILGLVLGTILVPAPTLIPSLQGHNPRGETSAPTAAPEEKYVRPDAIPLYFHSGGGVDEWRNTVSEMTLAGAAGVHQHIFPVGLPWSEEENGIEKLLEEAAEADPLGAWLLEVDCNPPAAWLAANPTAHIAGDAGIQLPAPASATWQQAVLEALDRLNRQIATTRYEERVAGVLLRGLEDGAWRYPAGSASAIVERETYREWLAGTYHDDAGLQAAWKDDTAGIESAEPELWKEGEEAQGLLLSGNLTQRIADFRRFRAETVADALAGFAQHLKTERGLAFQVWAAYGYTFDASPDAGHSALGLLLGTDVDGFVSPVSEVDRGLGGAGGFAGPVDSAGHYGKTWLVLDGGRTGITRDPRTGAVERLSGLRAEDIYDVQRRNFGAALVHGLGVVWSDPEGQGWLHDDDQWQVFGAMQDVYLDSTALPEGEDAAAASGAEALATIDLMVVIDEAASRYVGDASAYATMVHNARDAALRSGVSTRFVLLQDVLDEITPPATSYLFLNTFVLNEADRTRLHARLSREHACAIWLFAPGFRADEGYATDNISATVRMGVERFEETSNAGSAYILSGGWLPPDSPIGEIVARDPLFFVEDDEVDVLARFRDGGRASVATRYIEDEDWTTVYVAEPTLTPGLLREILRVNEQLGFFRPTDPAFFDAAFIGEDYFVIHAKNIGERVVQLDRVYNVDDCFSETAGWPERDGFLLPMRTGETRVLHLDPVEMPESALVLEEVPKEDL